MIKVRDKIEKTLFRWSNRPNRKQKLERRSEKQHQRLINQLTVLCRSLTTKQRQTAVYVWNAADQKRWKKIWQPKFERLIVAELQKRFQLQPPNDLFMLPTDFLRLRPDETAKWQKLTNNPLISAVFADNPDQRSIMVVKNRFVFSNYDQMIQYLQRLIDLIKQVVITFAVKPTVFDKLSKKWHRFSVWLFGRRQATVVKRQPYVKSADDVKVTGKYRRHFNKSNGKK